MPERITINLLRKRAEHNEGCLSTLEEITLHQQDLEKIEVIGDICRNLQILYLQNNLISKIENLHHLKQLWYLNLAINNITRIEGLEQCESLKRLDLTVNFITDLTTLESLQANENLEELFLVGNDCQQIEGYRYYVIDTLPQLQKLDGNDVLKHERIRAKQEAIPVREEVERQKAIYQKEQAHKAWLREQGIEEPRKFNEEGEALYGHSPEERLAMYKDMEAEKAASERKEKTEFEKISEKQKPVILSPEEEFAKYGRYLQRNQAGLKYEMTEEKGFVELRVSTPKHLATTLIDCDVQPWYVRVTIKEKILQLTLPEEVSPDQSKVSRAQVDGRLLINMPIANYDLKAEPRFKPKPEPKEEPEKKKGFSNYLG